MADYLSMDIQSELLNRLNKYNLSLNNIPETIKYLYISENLFSNHNIINDFVLPKNIETCYVRNKTDYEILISKFPKLHFEIPFEPY